MSLRVRIDGADVPDGQILVPGVRVIDEVGQRLRAEVQLDIPDGNLGGEPRELESLTVDHGQPYREAVLDLAPAVYWPLDDGGPLTDPFALGDIGVTGADGSLSPVAGLTVTPRVVEIENAAVPYGAAIGFEAPALRTVVVAGPSLAGNCLIAFWAWRDDLVRVGVSGARATITSGDGWQHVMVGRSGGTREIWVDGVSVGTLGTSGTGGPIDIQVRGNARLDELAAWSWDPADAAAYQAAVAGVLAAYRDARSGWRAFGGVCYGVGEAGRTPDWRRIKVPGAGYTIRLDRSDLVAAFASPIQAQAGAVARQALAQVTPAWTGTSYGCDLNTLVERITSRGGPGFDFLKRLSDRAGAVIWGDSWEDVHLDQRLAHRRLTAADGYELADDDFEQGTLKVRDLVDEWRTVTVARGGGIPGGDITDTFEGDGSTTKWALTEIFDHLIEFTVDGADTDINGSGDDWQIVDDGFSLETTGSPPGAGVIVKLRYVIQAPLVAVARDSAAVALYGEIVRAVEDRTIDTAPAVEELAVQTQSAHGQVGIEVTGTLLPRAVPFLVAPGCSIQVAVRGHAGEMFVQKLVTRWRSAGEEVVQELTLRAHDLSSRADRWRPAGPVVEAPDAAPVVAPVIDVGLAGARLPQPLGGDYQNFGTSTAWESIPGHVDVTLEWDRYDMVDLVVSFMAELYRDGGVTTQTGRVRLWDVTNGVTLGAEAVVSGTGLRPHRIPNIVGPAAGGRSIIRLQRRMVDAEIAVWGAELDVA